MSWYKNSISQQPQQGSSNASFKRSQNKNVFQNQYQIASVQDYQIFKTKDNKKLGWFFKTCQPQYMCLHRQPMDCADGSFTQQCTHLEDKCGAKIFEGASSVLSLCTPAEMESLNGPERVLLGIVPLVFCMKNNNLHTTLSSVQGKLMMKCMDASCPVIESTVDCESCVIAPDNLTNVLAKVFSIRDRISRQQFIFELLDFVKNKTLAQLQDSKLEFPNVKIQKMDDILLRMSGVESVESQFAIPAVPKKVKKAVVDIVDVGVTRPISFAVKKVKSNKVAAVNALGAVQKKKSKVVKKPIQTNITTATNDEVDADEETVVMSDNATSEEDEDME